MRKKLNETTHRQTSAACRRRKNGKNTRKTTIARIRLPWGEREQYSFFVAPPGGHHTKFDDLHSFSSLIIIFLQIFLLLKNCKIFKKNLKEKKMWKIPWKNGENARQSCAWRTWKKRISFAGKFNSRQMKTKCIWIILLFVDLLLQFFMLLSKQMSPNSINLRLLREKWFYFWFYIRILFVCLFRWIRFGVAGCIDYLPINWELLFRRFIFQIPFLYVFIAFLHPNSMIVITNQTIHVDVLLTLVRCSEWLFFGKWIVQFYCIWGVRLHCWHRTAPNAFSDELTTHSWKILWLTIKTEIRFYWTKWSCSMNKFFNYSF